jgi:hypothetical protein
MSDNKETEFVDGLIVKAPREGAPEYVKAAISIKRAELIAWLTARDGDWVNVQVKESKGGKWYAAVDNWKPEPRSGGSTSRPARQTQPVTRDDDRQHDDFADDVPFITNATRW